MIRFDDLMNAHPPNVVLYHADCMDGFGAAWALWKRFPQAKYLAVKHGSPPPGGLQNQHVVMVDFSYDRDTILALANHTASLRILDHHITAQASLEDLPYAYFDLNRSGAVLAWEWAHSQPIPWLLQYIQDKDLWKWNLPNSREISASLASYPFEFETWEKLQFEKLKAEGAGILRHEATLVEKIANEAVMVTLANHHVPAVHSSVLTSQIGEYLCLKHPFCLIWHQKNGRRYFSLRSKTGGISVADIAARYGGGGHTHAAGFSIAIQENAQNILNPTLDLPAFSSASS